MFKNIIKKAIRELQAEEMGMAKKETIQENWTERKVNEMEQKFRVLCQHLGVRVAEPFEKYQVTKLPEHSGVMSTGATILSAK